MGYTKGKWGKIYSHNVCIGIGIKTGINYYQMICNSILPDTDEDYAVQKPNIEADMTLISKSPEMHEALKGLWKIRDLLCYPLDVPFEHIDEAKAVSEALSAIECILIDLKS